MGTLFWVFWFVGIFFNLASMSQPNPPSWKPWAWIVGWFLLGILGLHAFGFFNLIPVGKV